MAKARSSFVRDRDEGGFLDDSWAEGNNVPPRVHAHATATHVTRLVTRVSIVLGAHERHRRAKHPNHEISRHEEYGNGKLY